MDTVTGYRKFSASRVLYILMPYKHVRLVTFASPKRRNTYTDTDGRASTEPVFVNLLRSPGIDSQPGGPVRQPYLTYRPAWLQRQAESVSWNRFLGSLNVYKYGLWNSYQWESAKNWFEERYKTQSPIGQN